MSHDSNNHGGLVQPKYRADIDGLRAVAVLPVVAFHAFPNRLTGGFIGVDIFFVISGFLISTIIFENLERGSFSFADFYARRVRRIFPALFLVLLTTLVLGWALLFTSEFRNVARHVAAGSAFLANFALWQESGYFDADSTSKPLVHLWSLGVEEQFYIVWPLLVWLGWRLRANIVGLLAVAGVLSFATMFYMKGVDTVGMFFSPLSRFWELLAGAGLAWAARRNPGLIGTSVGLPQHLASLAGIALIGGGVLLMSEALVFPGAWAWIPVAGAMLLIAAGPGAVVNRWVLANPVMVWFGLISYPLYLWHWPFLSYAWIVYGAPPATIKLLAVALSVVLAWLTYRFIERPVRRAKGMERVAPLAAAVGGIASVAFVLHFAAGTQTRLGEATASAAPPEAEVKAWDEALKGSSCVSNLGLVMQPQQNCISTTAEPRWLVVGDSHSSALFTAMVDNPAVPPSLLIGSNGCDLYPNLDFRRLNASPHGLNCRSIAAEAVRVASATPSLQGVLIVQAWPEIRRRNEPNVWHDGQREYDYYEALVAGGDALIGGFKATGKQVSWLIDVPTFEYPPEACERDLGFIAALDCKIPRDEYDRSRAAYREALAALAQKHPDVRFIDPTSLFCDANQCIARDGERFMYADTEHVNRHGAERIVSQFLAEPLGWSR